MASTADIRNGVVLNIDGQLWTIIDFQHVKPGKGGAFVRTKMKNVLTGKVVDRTYNAGTKVDIETVDRADYQYLYADGENYVFMDQGNYDQITLTPAQVGDAKNFMLENQDVTIALNNGEPLYVELPASVVLEITYTEPGPAGRSVHRWHEAGDRRDRVRDPGAVVPGDRHQGEGRHARRQLPRPSLTLGARTKARKRALDLLYGADVRGESIAASIDAEESRADPRRAGSWEYAREIVTGVDEHLGEIDEVIETYSQGWTIPRMPAVDRALLRIGVWELQFNDEIPDGVAIAEAVEAARVLSTEDSAGFINGLLGRIASSRA